MDALWLAMRPAMISPQKPDCRGGVFAVPREDSPAHHQNRQTGTFLTAPLQPLLLIAMRRGAMVFA